MPLYLPLRLSRLIGFWIYSQCEPPMDVENISALLSDLEGREFRIKPWGLAVAVQPIEAQVLPDLPGSLGFPNPQPHFPNGTIIFVHQIDFVALRCVVEVTGDAFPVPAEAIEQNPHHQPWQVPIRVLTPKFLAAFPVPGMHTFDLKVEFDATYPHHHPPFNIRGMQFGAHVVIPVAFARFLLERIRDA